MIACLDLWGRMTQRLKITLPSYSSELNRIENEWQRLNEPIGRSDRLEKTSC